MKPHAANWLTMAQCPAIWFWNILGILFFIAFASQTQTAIEPDSTYFGGYPIVIFMLGLVPASMMKDTLTKPFAVCLPDHVKVVRFVIFGSGLLLSALTSLVFLVCPAEGAWAKSSIVLSAASTALCAYLLSLFILFCFRNTTGTWGAPIALLFITDKFFPGVLSFLHDLTCHHPLRNGLVALLLAAVAWQRLGRRDLIRSMSGGLFLSLHQTWSKAKTEAYGKRTRARNMNRASKFLWPAIERVLFARMERRPLLSRSRFVLGTRFVISGWMRPLTIAGPACLLLVILFGVVFMGFIPPHNSELGISDANVLYLVHCLLGMTVPVPLFSHLLLPASRRDRFWASLYIGGASALFALLFSLFLFAFSVLVKHLWPEIALRGGAYVYHVMDLKFIFPALFMLPLLFSLQFLCPIRTILIQTIVLVSFVCLYLLLYEKIFFASPATVSLLLALSWGCFLIITYRVYRKGDLLPRG